MERLKQIFKKRNVQITVLIAVVCIILTSIYIYNTAFLYRVPRDFEKEAIVDLPHTDPVAISPSNIALEKTAILEFKENISKTEKEEYIKSIGGQILKEISSLNTVVVSIDNPKQINNSNLLVSTDFDYEITATEARELTKEEIKRLVADNTPTNSKSPITGEFPNDKLNLTDTEYTKQWALKYMGYKNDEILDSLNNNINKKIVAVIDSGICADNPDLAGRLLEGWDFVENDNQPQDEYNHGCGVAGIIAANRNNNLGIAGASPNSQIMSLKVLDKDGKGSYSDLASAIIYAADHNAQIINISLGGLKDSTLLKNAVDYALKKNIIIVASAGNTSSEEILYPAKYTGVISVGSVNDKLIVSKYSSRSKDIKFFAPGESIITLSNNNEQTKLFSGTSFAAPYITSLIAENLIKDINNLKSGFPNTAGEVMPVNFTQEENIVGWGETEYINANLNQNPTQEFTTSQSDTRCVDRYSQGWWSGALCYIQGTWERNSNPQYQYQIITDGKKYNFIVSNGDQYLGKLVRVEVRFTGQYTFSVLSISVINRQPEGWLDMVDVNSAIIRGWSFDPDNSGSSIQVYVFMDGIIGSGSPGWSITAGDYRPDVNSTFGISGNHGYNWQLPSTYSVGTHTFYAYGVDAQTGEAKLLAGSPLTITYPVQNYTPQQSQLTPITKNVKTYGYFLPEGYNSDILNIANQNISYLPHDAVADPVNTDTGYLDHTLVDLSYPEISGVPFEFRRSYNSDNNNKGILGQGWRTSYDMVLVANDAGGNAVWTVFFPDGHGEHFQDPDNNYRTFTSQFNSINPEAKAKLERLDGNASTPWSFQYINTQTQQKFEFGGDSSQGNNFGKLIKIIYPNGNVVNLSYDANGKVVDVVDSVYGRSFHLDYNNGQYLQKITDRAGRTVSYTYLFDGHLDTITNPLGGTTKYTYVMDANNSLILRIKTITDPANVVVENNSYDSEGRITSMTDGRGNTKTYEYSLEANLRITKIKDYNGNITTHKHDASHYLIEVIKPNLDTYKYEYDTKGQRIKQTMPDNKIYQYEYDDKGNRIGVIYPNGYKITTSYNASGKPLQIIEGNNDRIKTFEYNEKNNITKSIDALNGQSTFTYASNGLLTESKDLNGNIKRFEYDSNGYLSKETNVATGAVLSYVNDPVGNRLEILDSLAQKSTFTYDAQGHVLTTTNPRGYVKSNQYDIVGNLIKETDEAGVIKTYEYDANKNLITFKHGTGDFLISQYEYDKNNNRTKEISPKNGNYILTSYDSLNRALTKQYYDKNNTLLKTTETAYNSMGLKVSEKDGLGIVTTYAYDNLNHLQSISRSGFTKTVTYDFWENLISETDWQGNLTEYTYDKLNRLLTTKNALERAGTGLGTSYTYDAIGNIVKIKNSQGQETQQFFDSNKNLTKVINPKGLVAEYTYDTVGHITMQSNFAGEKTTYTYDPSGNLLTVKDNLDNITKYEYDERNLNTKITDANNNSTTKSYDAYAREISATDALGNIKSVEYDYNGNITKQVDELGNVTTIVYDGLNRQVSLSKTKAVNGTNTITTEYLTYDANNNVLTNKNANGNTTTYLYDSFNRVTQITDPWAKTKKFTYSPNGNVLTATAERNNTTKYFYDVLNRQTKVTDPVNASKSFTYDVMGRVLTESDAKNKNTSYEYDLLGNLIKTTDRAGNITTLEYDNGNRITKVTNANGLITGITYDGLGRKIQESKSGTGITTPIVTKYNYDSVGNTISSIDSKNSTTLYGYDKLNRNTSVTTPALTSSSITYNKKGEVVSKTDLNGNTTSFSYDPSGSLITSTDALNIVQKYYYDANGNLTKYTDGNNNSTTYTYDTLNRRLKTIAPNNVTIEAFQYDAAGNIIRVWDGLNSLTSYNYDDNNRVKTISDPLGKVQTNNYDLNGNLISQIDKSGSTTSYQYDVLDRAIQKTDPLGYIWKYAYDNANNLVSITDPKNRVESYTYDLLGRRTKESKDAGGSLGIVTSQFEYDSNNNLTKTIDPNGNAITNTYDILNRITKSLNSLSAGKEYVYDNVGNLVQSKDENGNITKYTYDKLYRKTEEINALNSKITYSYDNNGNLLVTTLPRGNKETRTYDNLNRLLTSADGLNNVTSYTYDNNNNLLTETNPNGTVYKYSYDLLNRQIQTEGAATILEKKEYDPLDRVTKVTNGELQSTSYQYDKLGRLTQVTDPMTFKTTYQYDEVGNLLKEINPNLAETTYTYNNLNFVASETDPLGKIWSFEYDKNGNMVKETDAKGQINTRTYDINNRVTAQKYLDASGIVTGESKYFEYDKVGNITKAYNADITNTFTYDAIYNLKNANNSKNLNLSYTYDVNRNVTSITYPDTTLLQYEYNNIDKPTLLRTFYRGDAFAKDISKALGTVFSYDKNGNMTKQTNPDLTSVKYTYDALDRVTEVNNYKYPSTNNTISDYVIAKYNYTYNKNGDKTQVDFTTNCNKNNVCSSASTYTSKDVYTYDANRRLTNTVHTVSDVTNLPEKNYTDTYSYDAAGNRTQMVSTQSGASLTINYSYNAANQLVSDSDWLYSYDANGNRIAKAHRSSGEFVNMSYNRADLLSGVDSNLKNESGNSQRYRLVYKYDALGRRVARENQTVVPFDENNQNNTYDGIKSQQYVYDRQSWDPLAEYTSRLSAETNIVGLPGNRIYDVHTNIFSIDLGKAMKTQIGSEDVAQRTGSANTEVDWTRIADTASSDPTKNWIVTPDSVQKFSYYQRDAQDTVVSKTNLQIRYKASNATGTMVYTKPPTIVDPVLVNQVRYDSYGKKLNGVQNNAKGNGFSDWNASQYSGRMYDTESASFNYGSRIYDAATGTWNKQDSYRGEITNPISRNRYAFVENNPTNQIDAYGFSAQDDINWINGQINEKNQYMNNLNQQKNSLQPRVDVAQRAESDAWWNRHNTYWAAEDARVAYNWAKVTSFWDQGYVGWRLWDLQEKERLHAAANQQYEKAVQNLEPLKNELKGVNDQLWNTQWALNGLYFDLEVAKGRKAYEDWQNDLNRRADQAKKDIEQKIEETKKDIEQKVNDAGKWVEEHKDGIVSGLKIAGAVVGAGICSVATAGTAAAICIGAAIYVVANESVNLTESIHYYQTGEKIDLQAAFFKELGASENLANALSGGMDRLADIALGTTLSIASGGLLSNAVSAFASSTLPGASTLTNVGNALSAFSNTATGMRAIGTLQAVGTVVSGSATIASGINTYNNIKSCETKTCTKDDYRNIGSNVVDTGVAAFGTYSMAKSTIGSFNKANQLAGSAAQPQAQVQSAAKSTSSSEPKVHGNSLKSTKENYGYTLRDKDTGEVMKFGETTNPKSRYSKSWLNDNNLRLQIETSGTKPTIHNWQHEQILNYKSNNGGIRPPLNKSDW